MRQKKVGRNNPCPCGSGKKYKQCCGSQPQAKVLTQEQWDELSRSLTERLVRFATLSRFYEDFEYVWSLFYEIDYDVDDLDMETPLEEIRFLDYLIHIHRTFSTGHTIVCQFLNENRANLTPQERTLLENRLKSRYGIFEIQDVQVGEGMTVKDLFDDSEIKIKEKRGTETLVKWDIIAGNVFKIGDSYQFSGDIYFVPRRISKRLQSLFLERYHDYQEEGGTLEFPLFLKERSYIIHRFVNDYLSLPPTVITKEGDEVIFCTTKFRIYTIKDVLALIRNNVMFEVESEDISGSSVEVTAIWHLMGVVARRLGYSSRSIKEPYSVFGNLSIKGEFVEFSASSRQRQDVGTKFLVEQLGDAIELVDVTEKSVQELIDSIDYSAPDYISSKEENEKLMRDPEIQAILRKQMETYYFKEWIYSPIPALNGLTPVEAYHQDPEGLDELMKDIEQGEQRKPSHEYRVDVAKLKEAIEFDANKKEDDESSEFDNPLGEMGREINERITNSVIRALGIDVEKRERVEIDEEATCIFSVGGTFLVGEVLYVRENEIAIEITCGRIESVVPEDAVYRFPNKQGALIVNSILTLYSSTLKADYFAVQNSLDFESKEVDTFQKIVMTENSVVGEICEIVGNETDKVIDIDIVDYEKNQQNKRSYFDAKDETLVVAENDLFHVLLYPEDFFEVHIDLVKKGTKTLPGRFSTFVIYMATLCLYSLEYNRRYDYSDHRFDQLFCQIYEQEFERSLQNFSNDINSQKGLTLRRVNKLRNYF